jgi:hypothetical protein
MHRESDFRIKRDPAKLLGAPWPGRSDVRR